MRKKVLTVTLKGTGAAAVYFDVDGIEDDDERTGNVTFYHAKRDDASYTVDSNQEPEMVYISQPRNFIGGWLLRMLGGKYVYPESAGRRALLYVIDSVRLPPEPIFFEHFSNKRPRVPMIPIQ